MVISEGKIMDNLSLKTLFGFFRFVYDDFHVLRSVYVRHGRRDILESETNAAGPQQGRDSLSQYSN